MRRSLLILALLISLASPAAAQITRDTQADLGNNGGATSTLTVSYTMGAVSNGLLIVGFDGDNIGSADDCAGGGAGVTFNGVAMTFVAEDAPSAGRYIYFYYLLAPASGAHNIVITCGSSHYIIAVAASYSGVGSFDTSVTNAGTTQDLAFTATVANNAAALVIVGQTGGGAMSAGSNTTLVISDAAFDVVTIYEGNPLVVSGGGSTTLNSHLSLLGTQGGVLASFAPPGGGGGSTTTGCTGRRTLMGAGCDN